MTFEKYKNSCLYLGDCIEVMQEDFLDNTIGSVVCDPPAGIFFMGKNWDSDKGGRDKWIEWFTEVMKEVKRVLKPGGYALVWALPRTSHWTATGIENAGFEIREIIMHIFGSGFPKSLDVSKAIDKEIKSEFISEKIKHFREDRGMTRFELGTLFGALDPEKTVWDWEEGGHNPAISKWVKCKEIFKVTDEEENKFEREIIGKGKSGKNSYFGSLDGSEGYDVTSSATPEAKQWEGWGTALKPAVEHWILARKPLGEKTVAANVLKWNCGGLNIDSCRVGGEERTYDLKGSDNLNKLSRPGGNDADNAKSLGSYGVGSTQFVVGKKTVTGRFPANLILSHSPECKLVGMKKMKGSGTSKSFHEGYEGKSVTGFLRGVSHPGNQHADKDGMETVEDWECVDGCPVKLLNEQSGVLKSGFMKKGTPYPGGNVYGKQSGVTHFDTYADKGGASRFFYCAKASTKERNEGCEGLPVVESKRTQDGGDDTRGRPIPKNQNDHPTVKSIFLLKYLCRLVTPPGGIILDPFLGSGSTGVAALQEGFKFKGIENDPHSFEIAKARISHTENKLKGVENETKTETEVSSLDNDRERS